MFEKSVERSWSNIMLESVLSGNRSAVVVDSNMLKENTLFFLVEIIISYAILE